MKRDGWIDDNDIMLSSMLRIQSVLKSSKAKRDGWIDDNDIMLSSFLSSMLRIQSILKSSKIEEGWLDR